MYRRGNGVSLPGKQDGAGGLVVDDIGGVSHVDVVWSIAVRCVHLSLIGTKISNGSPATGATRAENIPNLQDVHNYTYYASACQATQASAQKTFLSSSNTRALSGHGCEPPDPGAIGAWAGCHAITPRFALPSPR